MSLVRAPGGSTQIARRRKFEKAVETPRSLVTVSSVAGSHTLTEPDPRLEASLRRMLAIAHRRGGSITYNAVKQDLASAAVVTSLDVLDYIYDHLAASSVSLTDDTPTDLAEDSSGANQPARVTTGSSRAPYRDNDADEPYAILLCPEMAIDTLVGLATEGCIDKKVFLEVVEACCLSGIEVQQLTEYLQGLGFDVPETSRSIEAGLEPASSFENEWAIEDLIARIISHSGRIPYSR